MRKAINIYRNVGLKDHKQDGKVRIYSSSGAYLGRYSVYYQGLKPCIVMRGSTYEVQQVMHRLGGNRRVVRWEVV